MGGGKPSSNSPPPCAISLSQWTIRNSCTTFRSNHFIVLFGAVCMFTYSLGNSKPGFSFQFCPPMEVKIKLTACETAGATKYNLIILAELALELDPSGCPGEPQFPPLSQAIRELLTEPDIGSLPPPRLDGIGRSYFTIATASMSHHRLSVAAGVL